MLRFIRRHGGIALLSAVITLSYSSTATAADATGLQRVERLVVHYHSGSFELVDRMVIHKVIPPSLTFADSTIAHAGSWFELQTAAGDVLYRRHLPRPEIVYSETLADSTSGKIIRKEATVSDRTFVVMVPMRDDAVQVAFYGQPSGAASKTGAAQLVGAIRIR